MHICFLLTAFFSLDIFKSVCLIDELDLEQKSRCEYLLFW